MTTVLVAGVSVRAAAESAARAGFAVTALDAFADRDQHGAVRAFSVPRDFGQSFSARHAARAARGLPCDAVAYLSPFENHPQAVQSLAEGRVLLGNPVAVLQRVRDPRQLERALRARGLPALRTSTTPRLSIDQHAADSSHSLQLLKPLRSGGGHRIRAWSGGGRVPRGFYLQEHVAGSTRSVVFVANGRDVLPLGLTRQLTGLAAFGASGFRYCGSIVTGDDSGTDATTWRTACDLAKAIVQEFGLVGINGVDLIVREGVPYALEVNPRWTGSTELFERLHDLSVFKAHADACRSGVLPPVDLMPATTHGAVGKAIVFARAAVTIGDTQSWLDDGQIRDVPHPGERMTAGQPVCTVFAAGADADECQSALVRRAADVYEQLGSWESGAGR